MFDDQNHEPSNSYDSIDVSLPTDTEACDDGEDCEENLLDSGKTSKMTNPMRLFMMIILAVVTFFGVLGIYSFGRSIERSEFENGFESIAGRIFEGCKADSLLKQDTLNNLSTLFATYATDESLTWPFVALKRPSRDIEVHRRLAGFDAVFFLPVVSQVDRQAWERYSYEHSGWLNGDEYELNQPGHSLFIKSNDGKDQSAGPYVPQWQYSPIIPNRSFLNFNWRKLDGFDDEFRVLETGYHSISHVWTFDPSTINPSTRETIPFEFMTELLHSGPDYVDGEPVSFLSSPM